MSFQFASPFIPFCLALFTFIVAFPVISSEESEHPVKSPQSTTLAQENLFLAHSSSKFSDSAPLPTGVPTISQTKPIAGPKLASDFGNIPGFYHGVASGSPLPSRMIIWTRYTPQNADDVVIIEYRIAEVPRRLQPRGVEHVNATAKVTLRHLLNPARNPSLRLGKTAAEPSKDWTIKLDIANLRPKTQYVYAFSTENEVSPVGKFKTAPAITDRVGEGLNVGVFSCSNFRTGYFHAYEIGARIRNLDFWIHLGDYIYERRPDPKSTFERQIQTEPKHDLVTVQDYRLRYATYRSDPKLQLLHATAPLVATWDDHEFVDNAFRTGARKHFRRKHGKWGDRVKAAVQAYFEWMPIRPSKGRMGPFIPDFSITQKLQFGKLATLVSFDTRISFRSSAPARGKDPNKEFPVQYNLNVSKYSEEPIRSEFKAIASDIQSRQNDPSIKIAGPPMVNFLDRAFAKSKQNGQAWQILAVPVMMGYNIWPDWSKLEEFAPLEWRDDFRKRVEVFTRRARGIKFRASIPAHKHKLCSSFDSWCGALAERKQIINNMWTNASAAIVLGGDSHSSWAWKLYADGKRFGEAVAVNIGGPGVTSQGFYRDFEEFFEPLMTRLVKSNRTTETALWKVIEDAWEDANVGLRYANLHERGFFAMKLLPHVAHFEYFHLPHEVIPLDYETVARQYGSTPFRCEVHLRTMASTPGSLLGMRKDRMNQCRKFKLRKDIDKLLKLTVKAGLSHLNSTKDD